MIIRIWGVRGSSPTPLSPGELRRKIESIIQLAEPSDLADDGAKQRFLSNLPPGIFGTTGGNTACIEVRTAKGQVLILDTGTGLREFEKHCQESQDEIGEYHIFLSHFHYDHLLGIPFFSAMYDPAAHIHFYSPYPLMEGILARFMEKPYHPVGWDSFTAKLEFHILKRNKTTAIGDAAVSWIPRTHPGGSISYKVTENHRSMIYSSDTQLTEKDFKRTERNNAYFRGADVILLDAQYTLEEAIAKYDWGHSSYSLAVQFAREFEVKKLLLFHHDPLNSDPTLEGILQSAKSFDSRIKHKHGREMEIELAREGHEIAL